METGESRRTRLAVVTGANRGIGQAIARALDERGFHVISTARSPRGAEAAFG
ncbi:MAG: SDR family NAD(P)-dependent oxidoreductase, partial [Polyangiaceae bacterium]|nr:SDR family NAD(P)-dependent oxidoreductase [Polyangiaceae bacterium]